ncbi:MAG: pyridoxamine 5'-phosphate oxidase family protein [Thermomicrobiales bacterium]|nr:pyridoxamine 5'-phosphate oxidase family protein [Thermomicrobiales bacterium]
MTTTARQGDLALLNDTIAQQLLQSLNPARLAYIWHDGTPRVTPIWFHWDGETIAVAGPPDAPKLEAIRAHPQVALTIDDASSWPYRVLSIRGTATVDLVDGVAPEYDAAARRYFGEEQGSGWVQMITQMMSQTGRVRIQPTWVGILDFEARFPEAIARRMPQPGAEA